MRNTFVVLASSLALLAACGSEPTPSHPEANATAESTAASTATSSSGPAPSAIATVETTEEPVAGVATSSPPAATQAEVVPLPKMRVLVIGDSFAEALGNGLRSKEASTGIKFLLRGEQSTYIPEWAGPNKGVAGMVKGEKPDLVVIALGGNELAMKDPSVRGPKVKQLVGLLGSTPCVWVSPPLWGDKKDNGLLEVIRKNSSPCRYFNSDVLSPDLPRGSDKIHPTSDGQKKWAGHFLDWLQKERSGTATPFALKARPESE
jgi:hypothetical protein